MKRHVLALTLLGATTLAGTALAEGAIKAPEPPRTWLAQPRERAANLTASSGRSMKGAVAGAILIGLVGAGFWAKRRKARPAAVNPAAIRVAGRARIGARAEVVIVEVDGRRLLLGVTESHVQCLEALHRDLETGEEELDSLDHKILSRRPPATTAIQAQAGREAGFRDVLFTALGLGSNGRKMEPDAAVAVAEEVRDVVTALPRRAKTPVVSDDQAEEEAPAYEGQVAGLMKRRAR